MIEPFSDACFEILKRRVLHYAKFNSEFFDTELLKDLIIEKTGFEIGICALDMTFGIAPSKFKPSFYTLNVLAVYCGYENWKDFYIRNNK